MDNRRKALLAAMGKKGIPYKSDAFEIWDFRENEIITDGSNKYFKGQNGHNLLITGYDFDAGFQKGFLYKTAATVSAPAGDAAFIAADVNNFFYATDGTPNQIPVISLFQNVDYAGKFFNRHYSQTVDQNGVETYEPRVWQTVLYKSVKTGAELEKCNRYFKVPPEDLTAKWVDFVNGSDTTGNGTKALPYKTLSKINSITISDGSVVYVKTGLSTLGTTQTLSKAVKWVGIGFTRVNSTSACISNTALTSGVLEIEGIVANATTSGILLGNTINNIVRRCYINAGTASSGNVVLTGSANVEVYNTVFASAAYGVFLNEAVNAHTIKVIGCKQNYTANGQLYRSTTNYQNNQLTFLYNNTNNTIFLRSGVYSIKYNTFNRAAASTEATYNHTGSVDFSYNKLKPVEGGLTLFSLGVLSSNANRFNVICKNNYVKDNFNNTIPFVFNEQKTVQFDNNIIHHNGTSSGGYRAVINSYATITTSALIRNNVLFSSHYTPFVCVGSDNQLCANKITTPVISNNLFFNTENNSEHGIGMFRQTNFIIKNNKIVKGGIGIVTKALGSESSGGDVAYNLLDDCLNGLLAKGSNGVKFYNNTINVTTELGYAFCAMASEYVGDAGPINNEFKNNIVNDLAQPSGKVNFDCILQTYGYTASNLLANNNVFANNVIRTVNNKYSVFANTLSDAQTLGFEANSINQNPNLNVNLVPSTPISIGENLGATYEDGLGISTNWGNQNQVPVVVTKKQPSSGAWQVGAYVQ